VRNARLGVRARDCIEMSETHALHARLESSVVEIQKLLKDKSFYVHGSNSGLNEPFSASLHSKISVQQTHALGIRITVF